MSKRWVCDTWKKWVHKNFTCVHVHLLGHLGSRAAEPERERAAPAAVAKSTASTASGIAGWKVDPNPRNLRRRAHAAAACDGRPLVLTQLLAPLVPYAEGVRVRKHGVAAALIRDIARAPPLPPTPAAAPASAPPALSTIVCDAAAKPASPSREPWPRSTSTKRISRPRFELGTFR